MLRAGWILAALVAVAAPAGAQNDEAQRKIAEATQLVERGERRGAIGDRDGLIAAYREALALVDEAVALGAGSPQILFGLSETRLQFGEILLEAGRPPEAREAFTAVATDAGRIEDGIPEGRQDRLHLARALRGMVQADLASRDLSGARASLGRLLAVGRAMHSAEPDNLYLTRRLAQDLENEVFFRWVTADSAGSRETALEALALFRSVAEANPGSEDALRSHFRWACAAAALHGGDAALWREALAVGEQLELRREMRDQDAPYMRVVRLRAGE